MKYSPADETQLITEVMTYKDRPLDFIKFVFPWGEEGTPLAKHPGPQKWQQDVLQTLQDHIATQRNHERLDLDLDVFRMAVSSGRGIGKSALLGMLMVWFMSTRIGGTVIITANTEAQLRSTTMAELGKWVTLALNGHWFEPSATQLKPQKWFAKAVKEQLKIDTKYYYVDAKVWNEDKPDAFAGPHSDIGMLLIFDEASGIPSVIWPVAQGYLTDPIFDRYHLCFSNPRRNTGEFFEAFHKNRDFWHTRMIDNREVERTDKREIAKVIAQHGEDSDVVRVEVKGQFPSVGAQQFIGREMAEEAADRIATPDRHAPFILGVDVARFGDNRSVIYPRQGRDAQSLRPLVLKGVDTMTLAERVGEWIRRYNPDAVNVDGAGVGGGVVDRLRAMGFRVNDVNAGSRPVTDRSKFTNRRAEMWSAMREWLEHGAIPDDPELIDDLTGPEYKYDLQNRLMLERKDEMEKRGLASPDLADALALTFAVNVGRRDLRTRRPRAARQVAGLDYDVFNL